MFVTCAYNRIHDPASRCSLVSSMKTCIDLLMLLKRSADRPDQNRETHTSRTLLCNLFVFCWFVGLCTRGGPQHTHSRSMSCPPFEELSLFPGIHSVRLLSSQRKVDRRLIGWRQQWFWFLCCSWVGPGPSRPSLCSLNLFTQHRRTLMWPGVSGLRSAVLLIYLFFYSFVCNILLL